MLLTIDGVVICGEKKVFPEEIKHLKGRKNRYNSASFSTIVTLSPSPYTHQYTPTSTCGVKPISLSQVIL